MYDKTDKMNLTDRALTEINNVKTRIRLAFVLGVSEQTIINYIKQNSENLTKASAVRIIEEETGLSVFEILNEKLPA